MRKIERDLKVGTSYYSSAWVLFSDPAEGQEFAETLPEYAPSTSHTDGTPVWWKLYRDGVVVRLWSGGYGLIDLSQLDFPDSLVAAIFHVEDGAGSEEGYNYVLHFVRDEFDNGEVETDPDVKDDLDIEKNELRYAFARFCAEPSEDDPEDAGEARSSLYWSAITSILRFKVIDYMSIDDGWPEEREEMTEHLSYEDMSQNRRETN